MNAKRIVVLVALALPLALLSAAAGQPIVEGLPKRSFQRMGTVILRHGSQVLSLAYSPDGQILAAGSRNDSVRLWNPKTGELIKEISEHDVTSLAFTDSGRTLLMAGYQKQIRLYDLQANKETGRLEGHKAAIKAVTVSPDTTTIASGSQDGLIFLWEWNTKRKIVELAGHTDEVTALAFSPDKESNVLASAGSDRVIHIWNVENNKSKVKIDAGCCVYAIAFAPDSKTLFSAGDDHLIRRWDVATGKQTGTFKGHDGIIVSLAVHGDTVVSGSLDKTIRLWDAKTTEQKRTISRNQGDCDALAMTRNGAFVATAGLNNTVRIFDAANGKEVVHTDGPQAGLASLALSHAKNRLVSITSDANVLVWDSLDGKLLKQWDTKQTGETFMAVAPDGVTLATASNTVRLWNLQTGAEIGQLPIKPIDPVVALAFSPDGNTLALGLRSSTVEVWNIKDKKPVGTFQYQGFLHAIAWSPDGKRLAAGGAAKIFVWDPSDKSLVKSFDVKEGPAPTFPMVASLAFGPDSRTLAAGCFDAVIRVYNTSAKNPTEAREMKSCEGHLAVPYAIAFSPDGRSIVSGSFDRTARLWEAFSGKQIALFKGHVGPIMGVAFVKNGRSFHTASADTTVLQWDVPGLLSHGKLPEVKMAVQEFESTWNALTTEETPKGHDTMWRAIAAGRDIVAHTVKEKKFYLLDPDRVKKLFKDLDSGNFAIRTAAMNELVGYGRWMEGRYEAAMANPPSLEYKRRIEILKEKLNEKQSASLAQERLRLRRFMLICEQVGGPEAIEALQMLADRGPEEEIRDEAKGSLERLKK